LLSESDSESGPGRRGGRVGLGVSGSGEREREKEKERERESLSPRLSSRGTLQKHSGNWYAAHERLLTVVEELVRAAGLRTKRRYVVVHEFRAAFDYIAHAGA